MLTPRLAMGLGDACPSIEQLEGIVDPNDSCQLSMPPVAATDIALLTGSGAINATTGQLTTVSSAIPSASALATGVTQSQALPYLAIGGAVLLVIFLMQGRR